MTAYIIVTTILFAVLFVIWNSKDALNSLLKIVFLGLTIWGVVISLIQFGFIIKP